MSILAYERTLRRIDKHPKQLDPDALAQQYRTVAMSTTNIDDHTYLACITMPHLGIAKVYQELLRFTFVRVEVFETLYFSYAVGMLNQQELRQLLLVTRTLRPDVYENILGAYLITHQVFIENWDVFKPNPLSVPS